MRRMKKRNVLLRIGLSLVAAILAFWCWYGIAANYDYSSLAGTYTFKGGGENCILYLHPDRTFLQEVNRGGAIERAEGQWHRSGESHVSFSNEFLSLPGQEVNSAGQAHGQFEKRLGMFPILVMSPLPNGPTFCKKMFS